MIDQTRNSANSAVVACGYFPAFAAASAEWAGEVG